jgi:hypothetical protein
VITESVHPMRIPRATRKALKEQLDAALRALHYARDDHPWLVRSGCPALTAAGPGA